MTDDSRIVTGMRLLGLYFLIHALASLVGSVPALVASGAPGIGVVVSLAGPTVQAIAGLALAFRTRACARLCGWG